MLSATYSPEDNKLRLYSTERLDEDTYARVKGAGFKWAPRQELFVAPMWTPARADLLMELCGEIGDEDTSLVERAEERAERFEEYSDHRATDAEHAKQAVSAIADNIPLGQPILVGHHSERHARKDAEKIQNGMRRAVRMWETSQYWQQRAKGAIRAAKYKERPDVRARRIKGLESEIRKSRARFTPDPKTRPQVWDGEEHVWCKPANGGGRGGSWTKSASLPAIKAAEERWIKHYENRLLYERAMLEESGGSAADRFDFQPGGRVLCGDEWLVVVRVNKAGGRVNSVTTTAPRHVSWHSTWKIDAEKIADYRAPDPAEAAKLKQAIKKPLLCNYPGEGFAHITKDQWARTHKDYRTTRVVNRTHRVRYALVRRGSGTYSYIYITDQKRIDPPSIEKAAEPVTFAPQVEPSVPRPRQAEPQPTEFDAMRESLRGCA
jgi:hypothetical protein